MSSLPAQPFAAAAVTGVMSSPRPAFASATRP